VARFFKFHSLAEIRAEVERLSLTLAFQEDLTPLFEPVTLGPWSVRNALCVQPMEGCDGTLDGHPDELTYRRYRRFGAGGAGLIWGEAAAVVPEARANSRQLWIADHTASSIERLLTDCRTAHREAFGEEAGLVVGLQLTHSGRYSHAQPLVACECPLLDARLKSPARLLSDDDLDRLVDAYIVAAKLAHRIGFQFVDIKQCHRYLLNELLGARTRPGKYGGSLENRTRLARTIFEAIRAEVPGLLLATRLNAYDGIPHGAAWQAPLATCWGTAQDDPDTPDLTEPLAWIATMRTLGVQLVNLSLGNPYASPHLLRPFETPPPDGYEAPEHPLLGVDRHLRLTAQIQRAYPDLPVVGSGYSYLQEFFPQAGAAARATGGVTFVGLGRGTLSMPDFARLLEETGRLDRKRICRTFSYCTALMRSKHNDLGQFAAGCPPFDKEAYGELWTLAKRKP
jgi:2,4-dienoyl-CoA reductase-like NADH-dependent reductase (Old Yellow Enzyme family)